MSSAAGDAVRVAPKSPSRVVVISVLGVTQIFAWGSSYYLPAVLAKPIASDTGWSLSWVVGGLSLGLLIAGLVSPWVGRAIARRGGRPVLAVSAGLLAAGLSALALAHSLPAFLIAWSLIGLGMGAGLYDPAFATLGRLYGHEGARQSRRLPCLAALRAPSAGLFPHSSMPILGGAAHVWSTPASSSPLHCRPICSSCPANLSGPRLRQGRRFRRRTLQQSQFPGNAVFLLLAATITLSSVISTTLSVHLLTVLQARGLTLAAAVGLGALVGPSQVAARAVEMVIARYHHPIWTKVASTSLVAMGLAALWLDAPIIPLSLALYGAGIGLESIARGTLPLAVFGPERYPVIMGRIAMPSLIAQAAAPSIGSALIETSGVHGAMRVFVAAAAVNVALAAALFLMLRSSSRARLPNEAQTR